MAPKSKKDSAPKQQAGKPKTASKKTGEKAAKKSQQNEEERYVDAPWSKDFSCGTEFWQTDELRLVDFFKSYDHENGTEGQNAKLIQYLSSLTGADQLKGKQLLSCVPGDRKDAARWTTQTKSTSELAAIQVEKGWPVDIILGYDLCLGSVVAALEPQMPAMDNQVGASAAQLGVALVGPPQHVVVKAFFNLVPPKAEGGDWQCLDITFVCEARDFRVVDTKQIWNSKRYFLLCTQLDRLHAFT
jgi:hypothetical protein